MRLVHVSVQLSRTQSKAVRGVCLPTSVCPVRVIAEQMEPLESVLLHLAHSNKPIGAGQLAPFLQNLSPFS